MKLRQVLLTIYFWSLAIPVILLTFLICCICYPFNDQKTLARIYECLVGKTMLFFMTAPGFWTVKITDYREDKSWNYKRYVIIANHLSFIDSLVLVCIPLKKKFIISQVFTKIPIFGFLTRISGFVPAERGKPEINKYAVERSIRTMQLDYSSLVVFPEARREIVPYQLEDFRTGAYRIARATNTPILPVTLKDTHIGMGFGAIVDYANIEIFIDEPFKVEKEDNQFYIEYSKKIFSKNLRF